MNPWLKALVTAFVFLTRLPMPKLTTVEPIDEGRSLLLFPVVGLAIGLLLSGIAISVVDVMSPLVLAALLTAFWAAITGGLHLDGLADCADGWLAGRGDIDRTLKIMHDSNCGSGALVAVSCLLIMKFAAITVVVQQQLWDVLVIAPIIGRCVAPLLFLKNSPFFAPYVQPTGLAKHFIEHCPAYAVQSSLIIMAVCCLLTGSLSTAVFIGVLCAVILVLLRRLMIQFIGGSTGDAAGASTEIIETAVLMGCGSLLALT